MEGYVETPFPAYRDDEQYVFVCYAHQDAGVVYCEIQRLHDVGVNIWYDEGISPGQEWTQELADAIVNSSKVLGTGKIKVLFEELAEYWN